MLRVDPASSFLPLQLVSNRPAECGRVGLQILTAMSDSDGCVKTFANTPNTVQSVMTAMQRGHDAVAVGTFISHPHYANTISSISRFCVPPPPGLR